MSVEDFDATVQNEAISRILAAYPQQAHLEISGLSRRCGLTTGIAKAVSALTVRYPEISITIVVSGPVKGVAMENLLSDHNVLSKTVTVYDAQTVLDKLKANPTGQYIPNADVIIVDDFEYIGFSDELRKFAKTLVLCQTGLGPEIID
jgi:hypothetical protein